MLSLVIVMPRYFTLLMFVSVCPCNWYEAFAVCHLRVALRTEHFCGWKDLDHCSLQ